MTAVADAEPVAPSSRRARAGQTAERALVGGVLGAGVAGMAWVAAWLMAGTALLLLLVLTFAVVAWTALRGRVTTTLWVVLAIAWAVVLLERWAVHGHGGLWVGAAAWVGVVIGAQRAGIRRRWMALLAYPLAFGALVVVADEPLDGPWSTSWLWVARRARPRVRAAHAAQPARARRARSDDVALSSISQGRRVASPPMLDASPYEAPPPAERAAVAGMCSVAFLLVGALASLGAVSPAAAAPDWWKVVLLLPWYLVQGLVVVGGALLGAL